MNIEFVGLKTCEGKTLSAMKKAYDAATNGINTLLISTETTIESILRRYKNQLDIEVSQGVPLFIVQTGCVDLDVVYELFKNKIAKNNIQYVVIDHLPASPNQAMEFHKYELLFNSLKKRVWC